MQLPPFDYQRPAGLEQALQLKARLGEAALWLAGGSDLLVRAKQGLLAPETVISLADLNDELCRIGQDDKGLRIGASATLAQVAGYHQVPKRLPGLAEALASIGAPTLQQSVATVGGNLCAQTRCLYYNQSALWRSGLAPCFKLGGEVCHPGGSSADRCRSVCQADGAVMLAALGAEVRLLSSDGERSLALSDFFTGKGEAPHDLAPEELLAEIRVPMPRAAGSAYVKLALRGALDYAMLSAGAFLRLQGGKVAEARVALGAVFAAPLLLKDALAPLWGQEPSEAAIAEAAARAGSHAEPFIIDNVVGTVEWRRQMVPVAVRRALTTAWQRAEAA